MKEINIYSLAQKIEKKTADIERVTEMCMGKVEHSAKQALVFLDQAQDQVKAYNSYALMSANKLDWGQMKNVEYSLRYVERYLQAILKISQ